MYAGDEKFEAVEWHVKSVAPVSALSITSLSTQPVIKTSLQIVIHDIFAKLSIRKTLLHTSAPVSVLRQYTYLSSEPIIKFPLCMEPEEFIQLPVRYDHFIAPVNLLSPYTFPICDAK